QGEPRLEERLDLDVVDDEVAPGGVEPELEDRLTGNPRHREDRRIPRRRVAFQTSVDRVPRVVGGAPHVQVQPAVAGLPIPYDEHFGIIGAEQGDTRRVVVLLDPENPLILEHLGGVESNDAVQSDRISFWTLRILVDQNVEDNASAKDGSTGQNGESESSNQWRC